MEPGNFPAPPEGPPSVLRTVLTLAAVLALVAAGAGAFYGAAWHWIAETDNARAFVLHCFWITLGLALALGTAAAVWEQVEARRPPREPGGGEGEEEEEENGGAV